MGQNVRQCLINQKLLNDGAVGTTSAHQRTRAQGGKLFAYYLLIFCGNRWNLCEIHGNAKKIMLVNM
jgi:hypothetical protein